MKSGQRRRIAIACCFCIVNYNTGKLSHSSRSCILFLPLFVQTTQAKNYGSSILNGHPLLVSVSATPTVPHCLLATSRDLLISSLKTLSMHITIHHLAVKV